MDNVKLIEVESFNGTQTYAIVTLSDDSYESMTKEEYERRLTESVKP